MSRAFLDPHHVPPLGTRLIVLVCLVALLCGAFVIVFRMGNDEATRTNLPVKTPEEPIPRKEKLTQLPGDRHYVTIEIPLKAVAMNKSGHVLGVRTEKDGQVHVMLWIAGLNYDVTEATGKPFARALDINDNNEILFATERDGKYHLSGYAYKEAGPKQVEFRPLSREELRNFGLESLTIETDIPLDSQIPGLTGRKLKIRSIVDMTEEGVILGNPED